MNLLSRALVVLMALAPLACSAADNAPYKLGEHYLRVRDVVTPANPGKISVTEVFAYSCPHCFSFEAPLKQWVKKLPSDVEFAQMPHTLGREAGMLQNKASYTAAMLGVFDQFHAALFGAIHVQHKPMASAAELRSLFVQSTGLKAEEFDGAFSGFAVDAAFRRGEVTIGQMAIHSVPTLVVNGEFYTSPGIGGGFPGALKVADFLIEKARKERGKR